MTKRYKLLKDLPDSKIGDIYIWNDSQKAYYKDGNVLDSYWGKESVENNPDWFQEIKEPERIEVTRMYDLNNAYQPQRVRTGFETSAPIPNDKFAAVKQAIENVLNDDENYTKFLEYLSLEETYRSQRVNMLKELISKDKTYTQKQLNEEREKWYNIGKGVAYQNSPSYQDYLSSLKK